MALHEEIREAFAGRHRPMAATRSSSPSTTEYEEAENLSGLPWDILDAWKIVMEIFNQTEDEWVLVNLAAGPIESLLVLHGETVLPWIAHEAGRDERFRSMLNHVWMSAVGGDMRERLSALRKNVR